MTMEPLDLALAYPGPLCEALVSLPVNLTTAMVLVDSAQRGSTTPTPWPHSILARLPATVRAELERVEALLAHGVVLRDYLLRALPAEHPAHSDWSALHEWLAQLPSAELSELIARGIVRGIERYRSRESPRPAVEAHLKAFHGAPVTAEDLQNPRRRLAAGRALLAGWDVAEPAGPLALVAEPERLRAPLLHILEALWADGFRETWGATHGALLASAARAKAVAGGGGRALGAEELVLRATGLQAVSDAAEAVRQAERIVFTPCLHLGHYLAVHAVAGTRFVLYAPADDLGDGFGSPEARLAHAPGAGRPALDRDGLEAALLALGDATRLSILALLAERGELNAQQIAEGLAVHLSTVSRNLAQLEQAGLIQGRREGGVKRYLPDRERMRHVAARLSETLG